MSIPAQGRDREAVFEDLKAMRAHDADKSAGRTFGLTFIAGDAATKVVEDANRLFLWENGLDPTVYPSLLRLEQEVVGMAIDHLGGDAETVGNFTSGGTESIILAVKTARDRARALQPEIAAPEMVLPVTAHAAFHKAAHYLGVKAVLVDVDPATFKPSVEGYRQAITPNTVLLVGSAPSYAHGVVDPIAELGQLALEAGILLHVDGCIGGFMLPLLRDLGAKVTPFDFSVPGVTSISMDFHKYGFAAKGASVVLYKNKELRQYQIFTCSQWTGYSVINPTIQSSKSGGPLAATWAVLQFLGRDGYLELARVLRQTTDDLRAAIDGVDGLEVLGEPEMSLLSFGAVAGLNLFQIADEMAKRGWHMQPQLQLGQVRPSIHLTVMPNNAGKAEAFARDLGEVVELARRQPFTSPLLALAGQLSEEALDGGLDIGSLMTSVADGPGGLPQEMAPINDLLNVLPSSVQNRLLTAFFNEITGVPPRAAG